MSIKVGVVGCGHWGRNLVRNFAKLGSLATIVDPDKNTTDMLGKEYCVAPSSFEELLENEEINAIATASPAPLHFEIVMAALAKGKHVFVEKPISLTLRDGRAMRDKAAEMNRILMVGHVIQYHPAYRKLKEMVQKGVIGKLNYAYSNRMSMGKFRSEEDVIWSFAPHDISLILGLVDETPCKVSTHGAKLVSKDKFDTGHIHLEFDGGFRAHIFTSWLSPFKEHKFVAIGETGTLVFDDTAPWSDKLVLTHHEFSDEKVLKKTSVESLKLEEAEPLLEECRHFLESIETGSVPTTGPDEAINVLDVLIRAEKAVLEGKSL